MTAFFVATVTVKDQEKFQQYAMQSKTTFDEFGAEVLIKGKFEQSLAGSAQHHATAVVKFKDMETLDQWFQSDAYQRLIPLRDSAADITIMKYAVPEA